ncbi:TrmH family RNA methyltransferase [Lewinella sp. JB7]|uniref:TrmH family RNA methyltransferase n=1 Tax=Lewinella sp. JB7 TaxID=2962887 RepID=UPI0020C9B20B|nr:TrmH family RNA methyltransferase [Lewinella sp. JB7]MCP9235817.1 hypothetical protein [Lewinella sp. JB7]
MSTSTNYSRIRQLRHHEIKNEERRHGITLLCADWDDPRNVGSAFRIADAAGIRQLILGGTTPTPPHASIAKTARSTIRRVAYRSVPNSVAFLREARANGALVLALEITDTSISLFDYSVTDPDRELVLIAGNEAGGVARELLEHCDAAIHLPMYGQNTSMNVAVALGAAVYLLLMKLQ